MLKTLLITGGTGTLGSHLVRQAASAPEWQQVHSTYFTTNPNFHRVYWHCVDARNLIKQTLDRIHPTCIVHTMAMTSPDLCEHNKLDAWQINVKATDEVIDFAAKSGSRVVFASTDLVFDGTRGFYAESDVPTPISFYGDSKLEAENHIRDGLPRDQYVIARLSLLYGFNLNQQPVFFNQICSALESKEPVSLFTDQFRTPLCVNNAAQCLLEIASGGQGGLLHIAGPERLSRYELGEKLANFLGLPTTSLRPASMSDGRSAARRPADVSLDTSLARRTLKTRLLDMDEGLKAVFGKT